MNERISGDQVLSTTVEFQITETTGPWISVDVVAKLKKTCLVCYLFCIALHIVHMNHKWHTVLLCAWGVMKVCIDDRIICVL